MEVTIILKLDYTLTSAEERLELVNKILEENKEPNEAYLEILAEYLVIPIEREERRQHKILTDNRMATVNKRETSFEGLVSQLENGEDGIYNLLDNGKGKTTIFQPKVTITKKDVEEIPYLKQIRDAIKVWEEKLKTASGREAFIIKKAIIDLRKDQYVIKNSYKKPIVFSRITRSKHITKFEDSFRFDNENYIIPEGYSFCDPAVCSAILCNYSRLKEEGFGDFEGDAWYMMEDFDDLCGRALSDYPLYERIVSDKIDGMQNIEIQADIEEQFEVKHSLEYISSLWRKKIPKIIASQAEDDTLNWYFLNKEKGKYKRCSRCGEIKLAHNKYFSKNKTSKDGFYSICKKCRNKKDKK